MPDFIPSAHNDFNAWQKQFVSGVLTDPATGNEVPPPPGAKTNPNYKTWGIPNADVQELIDEQAVYQPLYDAWSDEDARSHDTSVAHEEGREDYEEFLRGFTAQWIRFNKKVNDAAKASLGLTVPDTVPTAVTPVDYGPVLSIDDIRHMLHKIRVADPENPNTQAMPKGHKLVLERFIGEADLKGGDINWKVYKEVGRFLIKSQFTEADKGKTAYYRARYITTRGEYSPYGNTLEVGIV